MVETAEQAAALVTAMRYPPRGIRGVSGPFVRASRWGRVDRYMQSAEEELCLLVQVETKKGLDNLDAITRVDGVDGIFIGPVDLSTSLGYAGNLDHPDIQRIVEAALRRIRELGKPPGVFCPEEALAKRYIACGANFVAVALDAALLRAGMDSAIKPFLAEK
jgi:2-keto-3-deoxy-L-rhamnonate aldolase RhmA